MLHSLKILFKTFHSAPIVRSKKLKFSQIFLLAFSKTLAHLRFINLLKFLLKKKIAPQPRILSSQFHRFLQSSRAQFLFLLNKNSAIELFKPSLPIIILTKASKFQCLTDIQAVKVNKGRSLLQMSKPRYQQP